MVVCGSCGREMKCRKNGVGVRFNEGHHVYYGDSYECDGCGAYIVVANQNAVHEDNPVIQLYDIVMRDV